MITYNVQLPLDLDHWYGARARIVPPRDTSSTTLETQHAKSDLINIARHDRQTVELNKPFTSYILEQS